MPQDALTIRRCAEELNEELAGAKVNKVAQPTADEVILTFYRNGKTTRFVFSANAASCRISPVYGEQENPPVAPNFCMLLRKHLTGAVLERAERVGEERIIKLTFSGKNDFFETEKKELYAEIMGKYSNLILVGDGAVLGSVKSYPFDETNKRPLIVGMRYELPPAQEKIPLRKEALRGYLAGYAGGGLGAYLFRGVAGLANTTAGEMAYRFFGEGEPDRLNREQAEAFADFILAFSEEFKPCVLVRDEKPIDFFLSPYRSLSGEYRFFPTLLEAEGWFYGRKEELKRFAERKQRVLHLVAHAEKKLMKRLSVIADKEFDCRDMEEERVKGELLTANGYRVPKGAERVELENYYDPACRPLAIRLDKNLTANENAQAYFKRYQKKKRTLAAVLPQREEVEAERRYLSTVRAEAELAERAEEFAALEAELAENGYLRLSGKADRGKKRTKEPECRVYLIGGFTVKAGKNNLSNDFVTSNARSGDLWLHTKGYHSAHVVIERGSGDFPEEVILRAAQICAYYSEGRNGSKIQVDYTLKKHVKKPPKAKSGFVFYTDFKTIIADPDKNEAYLAGNSEEVRGKRS